MLQQNEIKCSAGMYRSLKDKWICALYSYEILFETVLSFKHCASRKMKCCIQSEEGTEKKRKIRDIESMTYKRREEELGSSR